MCITPFVVKQPEYGRNVSVPCGKCPECVKRRVSAWSFRLMQEEKHSSSAYFITLTYDGKHVPLSKNGFMNLCKRDVQLFMKSVRKKVGYNKLKYYCVGEYGGKSMRPHYHILLFNADLELMMDRKSFVGCRYHGYDGKHNVQLLHWKHGHATIGQVTGASVGYTLKYMCKKSRVPVHKNDDREREFSLISKGIGRNYVSNNMKRWHRADPFERMYLMLGGGKKASMPRYYKDRIYDVAERQIIAQWFQRKFDKEELLCDALVTEKNIHDKVEGDKAAFNRMYFNSLKNQKL